MKAVPLTLAAMVCISLAPLAEAAQKRSASPNAYDGRWSVTVITERGPCDRASRLSLGVRNGVIEMGDAMAQASGRVDPRGRVAVRVTNGADELSAYGSLGAGSGSGAWRAPGKQCAGRWVAERRE